MRPPTWRRSRARNSAGSATPYPASASRATASGGPKADRPARRPSGLVSDGDTAMYRREVRSTRGGFRGSSPRNNTALLAGELGVVQLGVQPVRGQQLLVGAALSDLPGVDDQDLVGVPDGG